MILLLLERVTPDAKVTFPTLWILHEFIFTFEEAGRVAHDGMPPDKSVYLPFKKYEEILIDPCGALIVYVPVEFPPKAMFDTCNMELLFIFRLYPADH
jgi:hypothetical protein